MWNELLIALVFLQNDSARTLMAGLAQFQGRYSTNQPLVLAGALVSIAPVVLLYLSGQRFFVRGLTAGRAIPSSAGFAPTCEALERFLPLSAWAPSSSVTKTC